MSSQNPICSAKNSPHLFVQRHPKGFEVVNRNQNFPALQPYPIDPFFGEPGEPQQNPNHWIDFSLATPYGFPIDFPLDFPYGTLEIFKSSRISWEVRPAPISTSGLSDLSDLGRDGNRLDQQGQLEYFWMILDDFRCVFQHWAFFLASLFNLIYIMGVVSSNCWTPTTHIPRWVLPTRRCRAECRRRRSTACPPGIKLWATG